MNTARKFGVLLVLLLLTACAKHTSKDLDETIRIDQPVSTAQILNLLCDTEINCVSQQCPTLESCPLIIALRHPVVFDFVEIYAACNDCNTGYFSPEEGIGKCIEYNIQPLDDMFMVVFQISENCNFRYEKPEETRINVIVNPEDETIRGISPQVEFIINRSYCQKDSDCRALSGSGLELIGCNNYFYAPLNRSGFYESTDCICKQKRCTNKK